MTPHAPDPSAQPEWRGGRLVAPHVSEKMICVHMVGLSPGMRCGACDNAGLGVIWECDNCGREVETSLDDEPPGWLVEEPDEDDYPEDEEVPWDLIVCAECRVPASECPACADRIESGEAS